MGFEVPNKCYLLSIYYVSGTILLLLTVYYLPNQGSRSYHSPHFTDGKLRQGGEATCHDQEHIMRAKIHVPINMAEPMTLMLDYPASKYFLNPHLIANIDAVLKNPCS